MEMVVCGLCVWLEGCVVVLYGFVDVWVCKDDVFFLIVLLVGEVLGQYEFEIVVFVWGECVYDVE